MPEFSPGEIRTAVASMSNPTAKGFSYTAELYLGLPKVASSGVIPFSLAAGETRNVSFPVTMPDAPGTYPVYLDVLVAGQLLGAYQATEDVVIAAPAVPQFYMPAGMRKAMYPTIEPYTVCEVWCDINNKGDAPGTRNVHIWDSVGNVDFTMEVTLQPGETYTWHRTQWIDFSRISRYWVKAQGDWIGNNYSEAIFP